MVPGATFEKVNIFLPYISGLHELIIQSQCSFIQVCYYYLMKKTIFIGQAMPRFKKDPHDWPSLNKWLFDIGLTIEQLRKNTLYSALVDYFPGSKNGSHLVPTGQEIVNERKRLHKTIKRFDPEIVVPIGSLSISYCLDMKILPLKKHIGKTYFLDPYLALGENRLIIPLPHPSGASTWKHSKENKLLLKEALNLLKSSIFL